MEKENIQLQAQVYQNVKERKEADDKTAELLDIFDEVMPSVCPSRTSPLSVHQVYEKWSKLPMDDIEMWTVQTVESSGPPQPP